ncbi:MAG: tRNA pseudouridine(38-40) synthase TruA [Epsilonproteobacteria bacterium]|nr:tRNA pseudouridine(38-40) synthase TruA [Campylobacterota bacterium]
MRVKATIEYDGSKFYGFQRQKSRVDTITQRVEESLKKLNIVSDIRGSGRTDRGVHASNQVIDFEVPHFWQDLKRLKYNLNRDLRYIRFKNIIEVDENFHSRFSARRRVYRYIFKTSSVSIFERDYISHYPEFNIKLLLKALRNFEGEHNFKYFKKSGSTTHTDIRTIYKTKYKNIKNYHIIYFEANGFLRSQVRIMVDFAINISLKKLTLKQQLEQLNLIKRHSIGLAPPEGLYLTRIIY